MTDRIEKQIEISAPQSRVWQALVDADEFGKWFGVKLEGPFRVGEATRGQLTYPKFEHIVWEAQIKAIEAEHYFAFTWHPYAMDPDVDYSDEPPTLIEFRLESMPGGTLLKVVESGFDAIPAGRRPEALRMNTHGWEVQIQNIKRHVE